MKLAHINIVTRDADALARFYVTALGCAALREPRVLSGEKVSRGNGLAGCEICSVWLGFPGADTPFLELHQHKTSPERGPSGVNAPGIRHLAFRVKDIHATLSAIIGAGGAALGDITDFGTAQSPYYIVYASDPEGNILELEQPGENP